MADAPLPPVRLRPEEIAAVKRIVAEHFGPEAEVGVFGGRARLDQSGGDLDLHVVVPGGMPPFDVEVSVGGVLEKAMDDRHVDLILLGAEDPPRRIDEAVLATGVLL